MIGLGGIVDTEGRVFNLMQDDGEFFLERNGETVVRLRGDAAERLADAILRERALLKKRGACKESSVVAWGQHLLEKKAARKGPEALGLVRGRSQRKKVRRAD